MSSYDSLIGSIVGKWVVTQKRAMRGRCLYLECYCDCGNVKYVRAANLRNGNSCGCGCDRNEKAWAASTRHGGWDDPLYDRWISIKRRCHNSKNKDYDRYGGRGIEVCKEWYDNFNQFKLDMADGYAEGLQIDRIDNDKGYSKDNCRWATPRQNGRNRDNNRIITFNGLTRTLAEWADITGIGYSTLQKRIGEYGWGIEKALTTNAALSSTTNISLNDLTMTPIQAITEIQPLQAIQQMESL